jgi:hypothetical protein
MQDALLTCVDGHYRTAARRFLSGLSVDELAYIADFMATCMLERHAWPRCTREQVSAWIGEFSRLRPGGSDQDDKPLLLFEFLSRCGVGN